MPHLLRAAAPIHGVDHGTADAPELAVHCHECSLDEEGIPIAQFLRLRDNLAQPAACRKHAAVDGIARCEESKLLHIRLGTHARRRLRNVGEMREPIRLEPLHRTREKILLGGQLFECLHVECDENLAFLFLHDTDLLILTRELFERRRKCIPHELLHQ